MCFLDDSCHNLHASNLRFHGEDMGRYGSLFGGNFSECLSIEYCLTILNCAGMLFLKYASKDVYVADSH